MSRPNVGGDGRQKAADQSEIGSRAVRPVGQDWTSSEIDRADVAQKADVAEIIVARALRRDDLRPRAFERGSCVEDIRSRPS